MEEVKKVKKLTFEEWLAGNEEEQECSECFGTGQTTCERCDGLGKIDPKISRDAYKERLLKDLAAWNKYHANL